MTTKPVYLKYSGYLSAVGVNESYGVLSPLNDVIESLDVIDKTLLMIVKKNLIWAVTRILDDVYDNINGQLQEEHI